MSLVGVMQRVIVVASLSVALMGCTVQPQTQSEFSESPQKQILQWPLTTAQTETHERIKLTTDRAELTLLLADTESERQQGLSGRDELPLDGMLFVIDPVRQTDIWMRDMRFDLDIIWLRDGRVVHRELSVPAARAQDRNPPTYGPSAPVDAVVEVAAGTAEHWGFGPEAEVRPGELI